MRFILGMKKKEKVVIYFGGSGGFQQVYVMEPPYVPPKTK